MIIARSFGEVTHCAAVWTRRLGSTCAVDQRRGEAVNNVAIGAMDMGRNDYGLARRRCIERGGKRLLPIHPTAKAATTESS
jgi:hypothetical protein